MVVPWGNAIRPLNLAANHDLPKASRKNFPRFNGDGTVSIEKNMSAFHKACGVVNPQHEDTTVRMFVNTLVDDVVDWFQDLPTSRITRWNDMKQRFEGRYNKRLEDAQVLLLQLAQIKKESSISMRDFNAKFNKLIKRIPATSAPIGDNQKTFYIGSMPPELGYQIRRANVAYLQAAQTLAVEMEDDMIASRKWKKKFHTRTTSSAASTSTSKEVMLPKLSNDLIAFKKQVTKPTHSFHQPCQEGSRYQGRNKNLQIHTAQQRLAIEAPPKRHNMCVFYLRVDHDGDTCVDMIKYRQMEEEKEKRIEYPKSEDNHAPHGDSINLFYEYESDSENGGDCFATLDGPQLIVMTRIQKNKNQASNAIPTKNQASSKKADKDNSIASSSS